MATLKSWTFAAASMRKDLTFLEDALKEMYKRKSALRCGRLSRMNCWGYLYANANAGGHLKRKEWNSSWSSDRCSRHQK